MKRYLTLALTPITILALALAAGHLSRPVAAQTKATATNIPVIPHEAVPNFFKNPPGIYTGENMGISTHSKGNIYIYHRAYETRLFEHSPPRNFTRGIGRNNDGFGFAHSLRVDTQHTISADFQGNVYVGDRGNARVQVLDNALNWKANYSNVGNPWAVCVSGGPGPKNPGKQYLYASNSWPDSAPAAAAEFTGEVYKMELDGTIVGKF